MMGCLQLPSLADKDLQIQIFLTVTCRQACVTLPWMEEHCEAGMQARASVDTSVKTPFRQKGMARKFLPPLPVLWDGRNIGSPGEMGRRGNPLGDKQKHWAHFLPRSNEIVGSRYGGWGLGQVVRRGVVSNGATFQQCSHSQRVSEHSKETQDVQGSNKVLLKSPRLSRSQRKLYEGDLSPNERRASLQAKKSEICV